MEATNERSRTFMKNDGKCVVTFEAGEWNATCSCRQRVTLQVAMSGQCNWQEVSQPHPTELTKLDTAGVFHVEKRSSIDYPIFAVIRGCRYCVPDADADAHAVREVWSPTRCVTASEVLESAEKAIGAPIMNDVRGDLEAARAEIATLKNVNLALESDVAAERYRYGKKMRAIADVVETLRRAVEVATKGD